MGFTPLRNDESPRKLSFVNPECCEQATGASRHRDNALRGAVELEESEIKVSRRRMQLIGPDQPGLERGGGMRRLTVNRLRAAYLLASADGDRALNARINRLLAGRVAFRGLLPRAGDSGSTLRPPNVLRP